MTRDDIIRMAREAGIPIEIDWAGRASTLVVKDGGTYLRGVEDLERFAALVAAAEREACARVCDEQGVGSKALEHYASLTYVGATHDCAAAIRAREVKP